MYQKAYFMLYLKLCTCPYLQFLDLCLLRPYKALKIILNDHATLFESWFRFLPFELGPSESYCIIASWPEIYAKQRFLKSCPIILENK